MRYHHHKVRVGVGVIWCPSFTRNKSRDDFDNFESDEWILSLEYSSCNNILQSYNMVSTKKTNKAASAKAQKESPKPKGQAAPSTPASLIGESLISIPGQILTGQTRHIRFLPSPTLSSRLSS